MQIFTFSDFVSFHSLIDSTCLRCMILLTDNSKRQKPGGGLRAYAIRLVWSEGWQPHVHVAESEFIQ